MQKQIARISNHSYVGPCHWHCVPRFPPASSYQPRTLCTIIPRVHTHCWSILDDGYSALSAYLNSGIHDQVHVPPIDITRMRSLYHMNAAGRQQVNAVGCQLACNNASSKGDTETESKAPTCSCTSQWVGKALVKLFYQDLRCAL